MGSTLTLACLVALALTGPAGANHDNQEVEGPVPPEILERFADCPGPDAFSEGFEGFLCLNVRAHDGDLKLGNVQANVDDPIAISVGIAIGEGLSTEIVVGGDEGGGGADDPLAPILGRLGACDEGVRISGGILGAPELDPVLENDPIGVLCLSASPQVGSPIVEDAFGFLAYLLGNPAEVTLGVPLSIKLNNLLFGEKCQIGTSANPFVINLTNGTTSPPEGVEPISGETGPHTLINYSDPEVSGSAYAAVTESLFVDNAFAVPGASKCDILLGDLLDQDQGLFDSTINDMVGLPSAAGQNHAKFRLDTELITYNSVHRSTGSVSPESLDFGEVEVGESSEPQAVIVESTGNVPAGIEAELSGGASGDYQLDDSDCSGGLLEPGETCELVVRFTPTAAGSRSGELSVDAGFSSVDVALAGTGAGEAPLSPDPATLDFGQAYVAQPPRSQTLAFENTSAQPVSVGEGASLVGSDSHVAAWAIDDGCAGQTLAPGEQCTVEVSLVTDAFGGKDVSLELRGDGGAFLGSAELVGAVLYPFGRPNVPASGTLDVPVGEQSPVQTATFTNVSPNPVEVAEPAAIDPSESPWEVVDDRCDGQTVAPGASCEVDVRYAPESSGLDFDGLVLRTTGSLIVGDATLWGRAVAP